jgi:hypothetical protein
MWVEPAKALGKVWEKSTSAAATDVHTQGDFLLGQPTLDAKVLFYPVTLLFRTTPLSLAGTVAVIYFLARNCWRRSGLATGTEKHWRGHLEGDSLDSKDRVRNRNLISLLLYMFLFAVFMSLGGIKYDRYLLPIYPALEILAAEGLYRVAGEVKFRVQDSRSSILRPRGKSSWVLPTLALILQAAFVLPCRPYYLTYYNPMVGGSWLAPKMLLVGWGEGLDQAARYLNQQGGAEEKRVAVRFHAEFAPFYLGQTKPMLHEREFTIMPWHATDYVVFYVTQVQRGEPDRATIDYFGSLTPEYVVHLNGVNYAWIYPTPQKIPDKLLPSQHVQRAWLDDAVLFLGYDIEGEFKPGRIVHLTLFWQALQPMEADYTVFTHLIDGEGNLWGQKDNPPVDGFYPTSRWEEGEVVRDQYNLVISPDAPLGEYWLAVGMYLAETGERLEARGEEGPLPENRILLPHPVMIR